MCFPGIETATMFLGAGASLMQGFAGMTAGSASAGALKDQGDSELQSAITDAAGVADSGSYQIASQRNDAVASGNLSAMEIVADNAAKLGQDIDAIIYGGRLRRAESRYRGKQALAQGRAGLLGGLVGAAGSLAPLAAGAGSGTATGMLYGQQGRFGAGSRLTGSTGRIIGGI